MTAVGAENTTVAGIGGHQFLAVFTFIQVDTGIQWHGFIRSVTAVGAGNAGSGMQMMLHEWVLFLAFLKYVINGYRH